MATYDLVVLGGGSAGLSAAHRVAAAGKKVALVERDKRALSAFDAAFLAPVLAFAESLAIDLDGNVQKVDYASLPQVVFTTPALARVGLSLRVPDRDEHARAFIRLWLTDRSRRGHVKPGGCLPLNRRRIVGIVGQLRRTAPSHRDADRDGC